MSKNRISFRKACMQGLRPDFGTTPTDYLANCSNLKPTGSRGMTVPDAMSYGLTGSPPSNPGTYPFPCLMPGSERHMLLGVDSTKKLYSVNVSLAVTEKTATMVNQNDGTGLTSILYTDGQAVQYAERNDIWFISYLSGFHCNAPVYGGNDIFTNNPVLTSVYPVGVCISNDGQLLMGGMKDKMSSHWTVDSFGTDLWNIWRKAAPSNYIIQTDDKPDMRCILWGMDGGGDPEYPYTVLLSAITGYTSPGTPDIADAIKDAARNWKIGFAFIPWGGEVRSIRNLGEDVMIYGTEGVGFMRKSERGWSIRQLTGSGCDSSMLTYDPQRHIFIDTESVLWEVTPGPKLKRLGYDDFLEDLDITNPITVNYDKYNKDYYICDGSIGFILSEYGLGKPYYEPWSMLCQNGALYGSYNVAADTDTMVKTDAFDFDSRSVKTMELVEVGTVATSLTTEVAVRGRMESAAYVALNTPVDLGKKSIADIMQSAVEFTIEVSDDGPWGRTGIQYFNAVIRDDGKYGVGEYL